MMRTRIEPKWAGAGVVVGLGLLLVVCADTHAAEDFTVFGLRHTLLTNTVLNTNTSSALRVENASLLGCPDYECDPLDGFGVTVHLGEAESGLFAYPDDAGAVREVESSFSGYLLQGLAYGSVEGVTNQWISSLSATRVGWGQYVMMVDFTPLGATSYTYEVFSYGVRTLFATNQGTCSGLSTYDIEPGIPPRANPFWRLSDGVGAVIELPGVTRFFVCNGASGVGERMVIRAEGVTSRVDYVSRVDVLGSDGLPRFAIEDERLGMFGFAHRALGDVTLAAAGGELTVAGFGAHEEHGVMVEVPRALRWEGELRPLTLSNDNTVMLLSAAGTSSTNSGGAFYGPVGVGRSGGAGYLIASFSGLSATGVVVEAFLQDASAGSVVVPGVGALGILAATNPTIVRCSASARDGNTAAWFSFKLAEPTVFTATNGVILTGNEFRLSPAAPTEVVGTLKHVVLQGLGLDRLTLMNETAQSAPVPPLVLGIQRADTGITLSWPATLGYHSLVSTRNLNEGSWQSYGSGVYQYADFRMYITVPELTNTTRYLQLQHFYHYYIYPDTP
jgi:hypothetical protein